MTVWASAVGEARRLGRALNAWLDTFAPLDPGRPSQGSAEISLDAETRARDLLLRLLDARQFEQFRAYGYFIVEVSGRGAFRIEPRAVLNVVHVQTRRVFCCVCSTDVPLCDLMLAQKLLLESDPELFVRTANWRDDDMFGPLRQGPPPPPGTRVRKRGTVRCSSLSAIPHNDRLG